MPQVQTYAGPVEAADLGRTLAHEHVFVLTPEMRDGFGAGWQGWDEQEQVVSAVTTLQGLVDRGVRTVVDPTVPGLGRDVALVARVVAQVPDLHVVPATGYYTYDSVPFPLSYQGPGALLDGPDPLVDLFVRDLEQGMAGGEVRAHLLKCAVDAPGMTDGVARVLRAVAAAHERTGAPVLVHTEVHDGSGTQVQELLREQGVALDRVVLGHCGDSGDVGYLKTLADAGSVLGMDRFGLDLFRSTEDRVATVAQLCADGYAERMVLSADASCHIDWFPPGAPAQIQPRWAAAHVLDDVLPMLADAGVSDEQVEAMLVTAPARWLAAAGG